MGGFIPLWRQISRGSADPYAGDPYLRLVLGVIYIILFLWIFHLKSLARIIIKRPILWLLWGWACFSIFWSGEPLITLRRVMVAGFATLYGVLLFERYTFDEVFAILKKALAFVLISSLILIVVMPHWAIMTAPHTGAWRGIFTHKNQLGQMSVLGGIVFSLGAVQSIGWRRWLHLSFLALAVIMLLGSRSTTALVLSVLLMTVVLLYRVISQLPGLIKGAITSLAVGLSIPAMVVVPPILEGLLGFLGKDLTLSGRVQLWAFLLPYALKKIITGYGYSAFWLGFNGPSADVWDVFSWYPPHAHNGYLDVWLELGMTGLLIWMVMLVLLVLRQLRTCGLGVNAKHCSFIWLFVFYFMINNITYSLVLESGLVKGVFWVLFVYVYYLAGSIKTKNEGDLINDAQAYNRFSESAASDVRNLCL